MQRSGVNILDPVGEVLGREEYDQWWFVQGRRYYLKDHLGSTRVVLDGNGSVVETRDHYPFGLEMPGRSFVSGQRTKENFTGHELDDESGLVYAGARYYMPGVGRWTSVDPLGGDYPGSSPYNYALNNPANLFDPTGLCPESVKHGEVWQGARCYRPNGEEIVVEASRISRASSFTQDGTFYFDASTREGRDALYHTMRANPNLVGHGLSGHYSPGVRQVAMAANIHSGQATFLRNSAVMAGHGLSVGSALMGVGAGVLGVRMMLSGGGRALSSSAVGITYLNGVATRLALGSSASFAAGGDLQNATGALVGAAIGQTISGGTAAYATRGLVSTASRTGGTLYRTAQTGRFVSNSLYGHRYGVRTVQGVVGGYFSGYATFNVIDY